MQCFNKINVKVIVQTYCQSSPNSYHFVICHLKVLFPHLDIYNTFICQQQFIISITVFLIQAAMEAMSGLDLFGSNGSSLSTIQVQADKIAQCGAILQSLLPRESHSKVCVAQFGVASLISRRGQLGLILIN